MTQGTVNDRALLVLVEDDVGVRRALQLLLQGQGYVVHSFASAQPALADPETMNARYLVVDYVLPDDNGINLVQALRDRGWQGVAVMITAFASEAVLAAARKAGLSAVLDKPFRDSQLLAALENGPRFADA